MDSFEVENFRSLKHLKLEKLARVNLLVGKNNSGKTSVLEGMYALFGVGEREGYNIIENERGLGGDKGEFRQLFYKFEAANHIKIKAEYREEGVSEPLPIATVTMLLAMEANGASASSESLKPMRRSGKGNVEKLHLTIQCSLDGPPISFTFSRGDNHRVSSFFSVQQSEPEYTGFFFPAQPRFRGSEIVTTTIDRTTLSEKLEALQVSKSDTELLRIIQFVEPGINAISLGDGGRIYVNMGDKLPTLLPLNLMGEGIQRLLDIASAVAYNAGGVVLIDEIDNGLHYSALRILWKGILQAAREYDVQIVATTHSAEALRHLTWVLNEEENASYRADVAAYTLIRAKDDTVRSYRYNYEQLEFAMEHDIEVRN